MRRFELLKNLLPINVAGHLSPDNSAPWFIRSKHRLSELAAYSACLLSLKQVWLAASWALGLCVCPPSRSCPPTTTCTTCTGWLRPLPHTGWTQSKCVFWKLFNGRRLAGFASPPVLSQRFVVSGHSSCLAPPFRASDASPECGRETSGVTGSSFATPSLVCVLFLFVFLWFRIVLCQRSTNIGDISVLPPSRAAVQPVRGAARRRWRLRLRRRHHWGAVRTMDAAGRLLPFHEESQRQAQCCETPFMSLEPSWCWTSRSFTSVFREQNHTCWCAEQNNQKSVVKVSLLRLP